jgi:amino-acid N-acetyltransferase
MDTIDIPPDPGQHTPVEEFKIDKLPFDIKGDSDYPIRKARVTDVRGILTLVNSFAASNLMLPRGPQYIYENIRDFVVAVDEQRRAPEYPPDQPAPLVIACGGLHVLWENIAEIRSTAIHPDYQHKGLGRKMVDHMKIEARQLGITMLFTWTLAEDFFRQLGV